MTSHCGRCDVALDRREMLARSGMGLGAIALADLLAGESRASAVARRGVLPATHVVPRARRVIYLFQSGGPSQLDLFDYKPLLNQRNGEQLPESVRQGQRLTAMSSGQASIPLAGSLFKFARHGQSGAWLSALMPHTAGIVDELCFIKSMYTEAINHDPAITFLQTGSQLSGRPSIGAWVQYGLGSDNQDLPAFVVLITKGKTGQPLYARLWGSGFLPAEFQAARFHSGESPVFYLNNPAGIDRTARGMWLQRWKELQQLAAENAAGLSEAGAANSLGSQPGAQPASQTPAPVDDPAQKAVRSRIAQYEMAFRMQASIPEATDLSDEPESVFEMYGPDSREPGTYAANCILARRMAERGVRFIQVYHQDWDHHAGLPQGIRTLARETDQPSAALIKDLKQRGLLDDTLVIWGGEFGRTNYSQGVLSATDYGRDHHPRCFTTWMAGGGVKPGIVHGQTCEYGYNVVENGVHVHDFQATLLHLLGIDHERLTYRHQGRYFRLTDVEGHVVKDILA